MKEPWDILDAAYWVLHVCRKAKSQRGFKQTHKILSCHITGPEDFIHAVKLVQRDLMDCQNIERMSYTVKESKAKND